MWVFLLLGIPFISQVKADEVKPAKIEPQTLPFNPEEMAARMRQRMQSQFMQQFMHEANPKEGERIFNDPKLGTNGKSCASCHKEQGDKIMRNRGFDFQLVAFVQYCYENALQGKRVIAKDKLNDLLSFLISKIQIQKREERMSE